MKGLHYRSLASLVIESCPPPRPCGPSPCPPCSSFLSVAPQTHDSLVLHNPTLCFPCRRPRGTVNYSKRLKGRLSVRMAGLRNGPVMYTRIIYDEQLLLFLLLFTIRNFFRILALQECFGQTSKKSEKLITRNRFPQ